MKKSLIRLAASVVLSVALVAVISASGILTNGHRSDGLFYQASGIRPDAELLTVNGETIDARGVSVLGGLRLRVSVGQRVGPGL